MPDIIMSIQEFVAELPAVVAYLAIGGLGLIPFVESYFGTFIGGIAGLNLPLAWAIATLGTTAAIGIAAAAGTPIARRNAGKPQALTARRRRLVERTEKYGVPIASLLAPTVLALSISTFIMVSVGFQRGRVVVWNVISAAAWGALTGAFMLAVAAFAG